MNRERLQDWANVAQILGLLIATLALIIQLVSLANPGWLMGVIGYRVSWAPTLLGIATVIWVIITVIAIIPRKDAATSWAGGRGSLWSYCAFIAVLFLSTGIWLSTKPSLSCEGYGITIVSPKPGEVVQSDSLVEGTYSTMPPEGHLVLYSTELDRADYWPLYEIHFDTLNKKWVGNLGRISEGGRHIVVVAIVGDSGRILYDQYWRVAREAGVWKPLQRLTEDTVICDAVEFRGP